MKLKKLEWEYKDKEESYFSKTWCGCFMISKYISNNKDMYLSKFFIMDYIFDTSGNISMIDSWIDSSLEEAKLSCQIHWEKEFSLILPDIMYCLED